MGGESGSNNNNIENGEGLSGHREVYKGVMRNNYKLCLKIEKKGSPICYSY